MIDAEDCCYLLVKWDDIEGNPLGVPAFAFYFQGLKITWCIRENEPMEFWLLECIVNALIGDQKVGHAIARFNFEQFISCMLAERARSIVNPDLREQGKQKFFNRIEPDDGGKNER